MSKLSRRPRFFASLGNVALLSTLGASFVCFAGCAGGSNPFCCDSKEKNQVEQNLERAQSLDEREKDAETTPEEAGEQEKSEKKTTFANILTTDGSGDATQIAAASPTSAPQTFAREPQEVPVTASTSAAARETPASNAESTGLLQAPVLPSAAQTPQAAPSALPDATPTSETSPPLPNETSEQTDAPETPTQTNDSTPVDAANASQDTQDAQNKQNADAAPTPETPQEKAAETPNNAARSSRRNGPQRAATRQVAQRGASRPVAVPQTRAAATFPAPTPVVSFRTRAVVPAVDAPRETPIATFRTRVVVP